MRSTEVIATLGTVLIVVICCALLIYLAYAMLRPERF